jgi:hypothetical protein
LLLSFSEGKQPTHFARVTAFGRLAPKELSAAQGKFFRRLATRGIEYLWVREWSAEGGEHLHLLLRDGGRGLTTEEFGALWRACLPAGVDKTHYCQPVESVIKVARYIVKDTKLGGVLTPRGLRRRVIGYSRGFLSRPLRELRKAVRDEWLAKRRRGREAGPGAEKQPEAVEGPRENPECDVKDYEPRSIQRRRRGDSELDRLCEAQAACICKRNQIPARQACARVVPLPGLTPPARHEEGNGTPGREAATRSSDAGAGGTRTPTRGPPRSRPGHGPWLCHPGGGPLIIRRAWLVHRLVGLTAGEAR